MTDRSTAVNRLLKILKTVYQVIRRAGTHFSEKKASESAASMAYYALFSLFPLILFLITVGSYILEHDLIQKQIMDWVSDFFPIAENLITRNIESVIRLRGTVGIIAMISMLWAATNVFYIMTLNINRAFENTDLRGFVKNRLVAMAMVVILAAIMILTLVFNTISNVLYQLELYDWLDRLFFGIQLGDFFSSLLNWVVIFLFLFLLYWWVPNTSVEPLAAISGVAITLIGWQVTTRSFMWYLRSGFANYELVYGSLGTIIILMLWLYLSGLIILFGAHLSSAVNESIKQRTISKPDEMTK